MCYNVPCKLGYCWERGIWPWSPSHCWAAAAPSRCPTGHCPPSPSAWGAPPSCWTAARAPRPLCAAGVSAPTGSPTSCSPTTTGTTSWPARAAADPFEPRPHRPPHHHRPGGAGRRGGARFRPGGPSALRRTLAGGRKHAFRAGPLTVTPVLLQHRVPCCGYALHLPRAGRFDAARARAAGIPGITSGGGSRQGKAWTASPQTRCWCPARRGLDGGLCHRYPPLPGIARRHARDADLLCMDATYADDADLDKAKLYGHATCRETRRPGRPSGGAAALADPLLGGGHRPAARSGGRPEPIPRRRGGHRTGCAAGTGF